MWLTNFSLALHFSEEILSYLQTAKHFAAYLPHETFIQRSLFYFLQQNKPGFKNIKRERVQI